MIGGQDAVGQLPEATQHVTKEATMTNNKKLKAKDLASIKGGAAKAGAQPSGLAKASTGRVAPKAVNLSAKKS